MCPGLGVHLQRIVSIVGSHIGILCAQVTRKRHRCGSNCLRNPFAGCAVFGKVGGTLFDVIAPPAGELFSETNDNSVAILLSYGTARLLLAGDAEAREEEFMASGPYTGPLTVIRVQKYKIS